MNKFLTIFVLCMAFNLSAISKAQDTTKNYLKGKFYKSVKNNFLVATEKIKDNKFSESVIVILKNDETGSWGLTINKPLGSIPIGLLIDPNLNLPDKTKELLSKNISIFWGGPVEIKKIFVLHSAEYKNKTTKNYGKISVSRDYNILFDIVKNKGPEKSLVLLGYSGWGSGQLEGEMEKDSWVLSEIDEDIIFKLDNDKKWLKAIKNSFIHL